MNKIKILFAVIFLFTQFTAAQDVPYVPTPQPVVDEMLLMAEVNENDKLYDLGSGDGRIVITAAKKYGTNGIGIDSNPDRIKESNENAKRENVTGKVQFKKEDLFKTDFKDASVVTLYLLTDVNLKLRPKLLTELEPGTRVVSHTFGMGDWAADDKKNIEGRTILFWKIPANASGIWEWNNGKENYQLQLDQQFQNAKGILQAGSKIYKINDVSIDGKILNFTAAAENDNIEFEGEVNGSRITGQMKNGAGETENITAERRNGSMKPIDPSIEKEKNKL